MKLSMKPHTLSLSTFDNFTSDVLIGSSGGKLLVMRVYPSKNTFIYIVTIDGVETKYATLAEAIDAYNYDSWD